MQRFPRATGAALVALLALHSPVPAASEDKIWDRDFTVARQPTIRIEAEDAKVTVRSWTDSKVKVHAEHRGRTEGLLMTRARPRVEMSHKGNVVSVVARMEGSTSGIVFNSSRFEVEVWLPRESNLIVDTEDGPVSVEDVRGRIELHTEDGSLIGRRLLGDVYVHTEDGSIELDDLDGSLHLETEDAQSEIRGRFDQMDIKSADGGIEIDARKGSKLREEWSLRSQDGGIRLRIPHDLAATLNARTQDGNLSIDLPVQIQGRVRNNELVGDLNGGGPTLRLRTSDGSIRVTTID